MSITIWMDSLVALFWINNPGKPWKVFVSNRVKKIAEITEKLKIVWKYCPTKMNLADLGSTGMSIEKMESLKWFTGPKWLLDERDWPPQPELKTSKDTHSEYKATELVLFNNEREADEWDDLLNRSSYWRTLRVTAWMLRFVSNCRTKSKKKRKIGPLNTEEILNARTRWVKRVQDGGQTVIKSPGWKLEKLRPVDRDSYMQRTCKELSTNLPWRWHICVKTHSTCSQSHNASWCFQHYGSCT